MSAFLEDYASRPRPHLSGLSATVPRAMHGNEFAWPEVYADVAYGPAYRLWTRVSGAWRQATAWIRVSGTWRRAAPFIRVSGAWK
jgi:hypothetical protein